MPVLSKMDAQTRAHSTEVVVLGDLDGDGEREIFVREVQELPRHMGGKRTQTQLLTYAKGAVVPYPAAANLEIDEVIDEDGDGRADLVLTGPFGHEGGDGSWVGPNSRMRLLAHGRHGGSFTLDDAVAKAFFLKECPKKPPPLSAADLGEEDILKASDILACALYWGASPTALSAQITRACAGRECWGLPDYVSHKPAFRLP